MVSATLERPEENPIEKIATAVYPPFALLAGMQLDLFTALKYRPMEADQIAGKKCETEDTSNLGLILKHIINSVGF